MTKLSKVLPIDEITDDFLVTSYDTITFGYKMLMPEVYTLGEFEADQFFIGFRNALEKLGTDVIVQKYGLFYSKEYQNDYSGECDTRIWNEKKFDGREVMYVDHYLFVSFYFGNKNLASSNLPYRNKKLKEILDRKYHNLSRSKINEYYRKLSSFEISMGYDRERRSVTEGICEGFEPLSSEKMLDFIEKYLSCDYEGQIKDFASYDLRNGITVGNKNVSVLSMRRMPTVLSGFDKKNGVISKEKEDYSSGIKLSTSYLFPLAMGLPYDHVICETLVLINNEQIESVLKQEFKDLRIFSGLNVDAAVDKKELISYFLEMTPRMDLHTCKYGLSIIIPHLKEDKLKITNQIQKIASDHMDMQLYIENRGDLKAFMFNLPGCGHVIPDLRIGWTEVFAMATHMESFKNGNRYGVQFVDLFGKPFLFDFWDETNKYLKARNGQIYAPTGEGKSFTTNHLLDQNFHLGDSIFIIDVDGSYARTTELNRGDYYDSKNLKSFAFNPFKQAFNKDGKWYLNRNPDGESEKEDDVKHAEFLTTLILSIWYKDGAEVTGPTKELVKDSIGGFYEYLNKNPEIAVNFTSYYRYVLDVFSKELIAKDYGKEVFNIKEFEIMCKEFIIEGTYGFLLNADNPVTITNRWVCYDLVAIKDLPDISTTVTLMLINIFQRKVDSLKGGRIRFFMDEAIDFIASGIFGDYVAGLFRKIRKRNGQVFIITQSIRYVLNCSQMVRDSIFENSHIKIALDHSSVTDTIPLLQKHWSLSDSETNLLRNMKVEKSTPWRLVFIKFGSMPAFLVRHEVSKQTFAAYNTDAHKVAEINEVMERTGSLNSAIETFIENQENKTLNHE